MRLLGWRPAAHRWGGRTAFWTGWTGPLLAGEVADLGGDGRGGDVGGIGLGLSLLGRGRHLFLGGRWRERARRLLLALLTGSGLALPGGDVRQAARHEVESAESWKYQFKVVIVKIFKSMEVEASVYGKGVGKEGDPRPGRLEPRVWSRELARREPGAGGGVSGRGRAGSVPGGPGGFPVVRMPRPLPGARLWSSVLELGSYR